MALWRTMMLVALTVAILLVAFTNAQTVDQLSEKRILDCTLDSKSYSDCDPVAYAIRVVVFAVPGVIVAALLLLCCPVYFCGRYCCNCCGGSKQSPNFCCPNDTLPARYSFGDIMRPKVLGLICFFCALGAMAWGLVGAGQLTKGLKDGADVAANVPTILQEKIDQMDQQLRFLKFDAATKTTTLQILLDATQEGRTLKVEATKTRDQMDELVTENIETFRSLVDRFKQGLFVLFIVPTIPVFLGLISGLANIRKCIPMCMVAILFLFGVILWAFHGAFNAASMVAGDGCAEIHGIARKQLNLMSLLLGCSDQDFASFVNSFKDLEVSQATETCEGIKNLCYMTSDSASANLAAKRIYNCPAVLVCTGMTFGRLVELMDTVFYVHPNIEALPAAQTNVEGAVCVNKPTNTKCSIRWCHENCTLSNGQLSEHGNQAKELYFNFKGAQTVSNTIDTLGAQFSTCDSVISIFASPFSKPCGHLVDGLIYNRQATGLLGLTVIAGVFIMAWGAKRFISLDEEGKAQRENQGEEDKDGKDV